MQGVISDGSQKLKLPWWHSVLVFSAAFLSPAMASNAHLAAAVRYYSSFTVRYVALFS